MKKLFTILMFLFCAVTCFAQYPIIQNIGADSTIVKAKAALQAATGFVNGRYIDTTAANLSRIRQYGGAKIVVGNQEWLRDSTATRWILIDGGGAINPQCGLSEGGGIVSWDSLLVFDVSAATWISCCDNIPRQTTFTVVTLAAAHASLPRIDAIVLDPTLGVTVVQGTAAADPAIPDISPCQVFLTAVLIQAASTVPSGIGQLTVYDENNGGEWIPATVTGVTADFVNTTSPAHLLKAIHWVSGATGTRQIVFNAPTAININDYGILKLYIKLTTGIFGGYLMVDFPGATSFGIPLSSFGFNPTSAVGYQIISIPLNAFTFTNPTTVDQFRILVKGTTTAALDFYVDWVQFQSGINTPSSQKGITNVNVTGNHLFNPVLTYPYSNEVDIAFPLDGFLPVNLLDTADGNDGDFLKKVNGVWTPTADSSAIDTVYAKNWANARHGPVRDTIIFGSQFIDSSLLAYDTYAGLNGHFFAIQKDASTNRFKITPDSIYLAATISGSVTGMVWKLKNAATGSGYWGTASGGGGINLYNTDSLLSSNRTVGLNGHSLTFQQGANNYLILDPVNFLGLYEAFDGTSQSGFDAKAESGVSVYADIFANNNGSDFYPQITLNGITNTLSLYVHAAGGDQEIEITDDEIEFNADSIYFNSTLSGAVTGYVWKLKDAATGSGYWGSSYVTAGNGLTDSSGRVIEGGSYYKNTTKAAGAFQLAYTFNSLAGTSGLDLSSTSTAAASNIQKVFNVSLSGANSNSNEITYAGYFSNTHSGTNAQNRAIYGETSTASSITAYFTSTNGVGLFANSTGGSYGLEAAATTGIAMYAHSDNNVGINAQSMATYAADFVTILAATNSVGTVQQLTKGTTGTAANGLGGSVDMQIETTTGSNRVATQLIWKWTDATDATRTSQFIITGVNSAATGDIISFEGNKRTMLYGRLEQQQGVDVASAAGAIALGLDGNTFEITGTAAITLISNLNWVNGSVIHLMFTSTASLVNGTATSGTDITILLAAASNFTGSANDVITLVLGEIGGTQAWREVGRSVN